MSVCQSTVLNLQKISKDYFLMELASFDEINKVIPGQFLLLQPKEDTRNPLLKIPLAIYDTTPSGFSVLCRIRGKKTTLLSEREVGEKIEVVAPLGNGFDLSVPPKVAILVAGGCGVASLYLLAKRLTQKGISTKLFLGARDKNELIEKERFETLGCQVFCATDNGTFGFQGNVIKLLSTHLKETTDFKVYAAGPESMLKALASLANKQNFSAQLSFEAYMACGIGVCRGCAIKTKAPGYKMCCVDGPVFNANEVLS